MRWLVVFVLFPSSSPSIGVCASNFNLPQPGTRKPLSSVIPDQTTLLNRSRISTWAFDTGEASFKFVTQIKFDSGENFANTEVRYLTQSLEISQFPGLYRPTWTNTTRGRSFPHTSSKSTGLTVTVFRFVCVGITFARENSFSIFTQGRWILKHTSSRPNVSYVSLKISH